MQSVPISTPTPSPRNVRLVERLSKPYDYAKTKGEAAKKAYSRAKLNALYMLKAATIGSVKSMYKGRMSILVTYVAMICTMRGL